MYTFACIGVLAAAILFAAVALFNRSERLEKERKEKLEKELIYHALGMWYDSYRYEKPDGVLWSERDAKLAVICARVGINNLLALKASAFDYRSIVSNVSRPE